MQPWRSRICAIGYRRWSLTCAVSFFFFFSSRRRHTIYIGDWSSDVCSSDLVLVEMAHEGDDAAVEIEGPLALLARALVAQRDGEAFVEVGHLAEALGERVEVIVVGFENVGIGQIGRASCRERG